MRAPRLAVSAAAVLCILAPLAACSGSSDSGSAAKDDTASTTASTTTPALPAEEYKGMTKGFYDMPDPLPDAPHGTLLRYEDISEEYPFTGATTYRIIYLSESVAGDLIPVTGFATVPKASAPKGGRPMITIAHGTTGIADGCAPTRTGRNAEMSLVENELSSEYLIAATDYEGLGTPGVHPYLVGESEGRSTIDAILAAGQLPDADPGTQLGIMGYSQGGHGALWANQVAADWAPDLDVVGTFAGAPASEIGVIVAASERVKGFGLMVIAGLHAAYPEADLSKILTPEGQEVLTQIEESCVGDAFKTAGEAKADLFVPGGNQSEPWADLGKEQDAGTEKTNDAPILLIHSNEDQTVPTFFIDQVEGRMCENGQVVQRVDLPTGNHTSAAVPAYEQALEWMQQLFQGNDTTQNTCPTSG